MKRLLGGTVDGNYIAVGSLQVVGTGIYDGSSTYRCARLNFITQISIDHIFAILKWHFGIAKIHKTQRL